MSKQTLKSARTLDDVKADVAQPKAQAQSLQTEVFKHILKNKEQGAGDRTIILDRMKMENTKLQIFHINRMATIINSAVHPYLQNKRRRERGRGNTRKRQGSLDKRLFVGCLVLEYQQFEEKCDGKCASSQRNDLRQIAKKLASKMTPDHSAVDQLEARLIFSKSG